MFTYAEIILLFLKITDAIMGWVNNQQQFKAGADAEIAKTALAIAARTKAGKAIMEKVDALSDADVDAQLRGLEPK